MEQIDLHIPAVEIPSERRKVRNFTQELSCAEILGITPNLHCLHIQASVPQTSNYLLCVPLSCTRMLRQLNKKCPHTQRREMGPARSVC